MVNAFVPHEHRVTTAEAVAATVPFILAMDLAAGRELFGGDRVRALAPVDGYGRSWSENELCVALRSRHHRPCRERLGKLALVEQGAGDKINYLFFGNRSKIKKIQKKKSNVKKAGCIL